MTRLLAAPVLLTLVAAPAFACDLEKLTSADFSSAPSRRSRPTTIRLLHRPQPPPGSRRKRTLRLGSRALVRLTTIPLHSR